MLLKSRRELLLCLLLSGSACVPCTAGMHQHVVFSPQRNADSAFSEHDLASNSGADRNIREADILKCPAGAGGWSDPDRLAGETGSGGLVSATSTSGKLLQARPERLLAQVRRKVTEQVAAPSAAQIAINSQTSLSAPEEAAQSAGQPVQQFAAPAGGSVVPGQTPAASPAPAPAPATNVKLPGNRSKTTAAASTSKEAAPKAAAEVSAAERKADAEATKKASADSAKSAEAARRAQAALKAEEAAAKKKAEEEKKAAELAAKKKAEEEARLKAEAEKKAKAEEEARIAAEKKAEEERKAAELAAKKKAEEEKKAAELAAKKKAEEEARLKAEAEKKAKAEEEARIAAEKKAEEERKAAELAAKKKAEEEARKQAAAEEAARKAARARAAKAADEGLKLYNAGKYEEAVEKFTAALTDDPESKKALTYKPRAEKKLEEKLAKEKAEAERRELEARRKVELAQLKAESPTPTVGLPAPATDKKDSQEPLKPLSEVIAGSADKKSEPADQKKESAQTKDSSGSSSSPAVEADKLVRQAQRELQEGKRSQAVETARRAASLDPNNVEAKALVAELESGSADQGLALPSLSANNPPPALSSGSKKSSPAPASPTPDLPGSPAGASKSVAEARVKGGDPDPAVSSAGAAAPAASLSSQEAEAAFQKGLVAYQSGQLDAAVQQWNYALTLNPTHSGALQYLELTRTEYDAWVQQHQHNAIQLQKEAVGADKLETPITYDTAGQKTISEFLQAMSILTDVNFYVAAGVDPEVRITAKFEDTPLYDALDIVLLPIGLKWSRTADTVTITPDLRHKYFNLTPDQVARLKPLLENKTVQKYLYGPEGVPAMRNVELLLDPVQNSLVVTDSQENINKLEAFLKDLQIVSPPGLIFKSFKIRPEEGQKIKALVEALVKVQGDEAYSLDRKVAVDGDDLIIKDTADNIAKIEQLLLDKNFIRKLETQKLNVATFNLTPREPIIENVEQARDLAQNIVTVVKTILYAQTGESAAAAEGRRYFYDPNTLQLTITDYPENLRVVGDYIRSLPMLSARTQRSDIIFLKHQGAAEMADLLNRVLGLSAAPVTAGGGAGANSVTKNLSTEQEITFQGIRVRLLRVNENNVADENDDSAEFVVRTPTTSQDLTLQEFRSQFIEDYEISALQIRPSGTLGRGSVRVEIRYVPGGQAGGLGVGQFPGVPGAIPGAVPGAVPGVTVPGAVPGVPGVAGAIPGVPGVLPAGELAADVGLQIETIENMNALLVRYEDPGDLAELKGWIEQLDIPVLQVSIETKLVEVNESRAKEWLPEFNILNLEETDISGGILDARFANDADEFRSPFDPFPEDPRNAGLLKGRTVLSFLALGGETGLNFTLRALEAEGVLNMVNGPHVLVENGGTADFEINRRFGDLPTATAGGIGGVGGIGNTVGTFAEFQQVRMTVAPQITQLGEIRLDIQDLELSDFGNDLGTITTIDIDGDGSSQVFEPTAVARDANLNLETRTRRLTTVARVSNGGTIVLGGWTGERSRNSDSGVPILRNIPYVGKLLFGRSSDRVDRTNLLIFLTCNIVSP